MAFLKVFTLLSLAAVLASSTPVEVEVPDTRSNEHNYYACTDYESEKELLSNQQVYESASLLQVKEKVVKYPTSGISSKKITCINVQDRDNDGNGGYVVISGGGLNQYFVEITMTSQRSKGLNFDIEIYTDV